MGKHEKKAKKRKKHKKEKRKSSSSESSTEDEWIEKEPVQKEVVHVENNRDEWMSLSSLFPTTSHAGRRKEREEAKLKEKETSTYDPRTCSRELNPYWKQGGDGLPSQTLKFQKPSEDSNYKSSYKQKSSQSSWRKSSYKKEVTQGSPDGYADRRSSFKKENQRFEDSKCSYKRQHSREEMQNEDSKYSDKKEHTREGYKHEERHEDRKHLERERSKSPANTFVETKSGLVFHNFDVETDDVGIESSDYLTDKEMNEIGAKIIKAEILGNTSKVNELKEKLKRAQVCRDNKPAAEEKVILTKTDAKGFSRPLDAPETEVSGKRKNKLIETHQAGLREKYFPDDGKYSLQQMFENEKFNTHDQDAEFVKLTAKVGKMDNMDDIFLDKIRNETNTEKKAKGDRDRAINEHKKMSETLDNCQQCIQSTSMPKHLLVTLGETVYMSLPQHEPLTDGHCLIIPTRHVSCSTQLDENEWSEVGDFRKSLTNMFLSQDQDVVFYETVLNSQSYSHMVIHCVPLPKEQGDLAPIYFKKAIDECETEWMTNKKLVNLAGKDVRRAIPKGLPYFFVSFGMTEGFAHVIEDERYFPRNFAAEIIGGILDLHHSKWRNPRREKFDLQKSRVLEFSNMWKQFDCTNNK